MTLSENSKTNKKEKIGIIILVIGIVLGLTSFQSFFNLRVRDNNRLRCKNLADFPSAGYATCPKCGRKEKWRVGE
jgi:hypothetical protein